MIASRIKNKLNCHIITTSSKNISADYLLDLRDFQEKDVNFIKQNDIVIIAAGISSPDKCEHEYENAKSINLIGTTRLIKYCLDKGCADERRGAGGLRQTGRPLSARRAVSPTCLLIPVHPSAHGAAPDCVAVA